MKIVTLELIFEICEKLKVFTDRLNDDFFNTFLLKHFEIAMDKQPKQNKVFEVITL